MKLPQSFKPNDNKKYDSIFIITNYFTKYTYFIPYQEESNTEVLAHQFIKIVVSQHGLLDEIISNRGITFTSKFWQSLMGRLKVNHKLNTARYPQTDGQTERLNQTLE